MKKFMAKRILFYIAVVFLLDLFFFKCKWTFLTGLFAGAGLAFVKFCISEAFFTAIFGDEKNTFSFSIIKYILSNIIIIMVSIVSIMMDLELFAGMTAGILSVTVIIVVNAVTEATGLTNNDFSK